MPKSLKRLPYCSPDYHSNRLKKSRLRLNLKHLNRLARRSCHLNLQANNSFSFHSARNTSVKIQILNTQVSKRTLVAPSKSTENFQALVTDQHNPLITAAAVLIRAVVMRTFKKIKNLKILPPHLVAPIRIS